MMGVIKPSPHISNFSINVQNVLKEIKYITSLLSETFSSLIFYVSFKDIISATLILLDGQISFRLFEFPIISKEIWIFLQKCSPHWAEGYQTPLPKPTPLPLLGIRHVFPPVGPCIWLTSDKISMRFTGNIIMVKAVTKSMKYENWNNKISLKHLFPLPKPAPLLGYPWVPLHTVYFSTHPFLSFKKGREVPTMNVPRNYRIPRRHY